MKVYRYLHESELNKIKEGNTWEIGNVYKLMDAEPFKNSNTHRYKANTKYLHFFKRPQGMQMIKYLYKDLDEKFYFCTFDIPTIQLIQHYGQGYYPTSGYDQDVHRENEFSIPVDKFNPKWLVDYQLDTDRQSITLSDAIDRTK